MTAGLRLAACGLRLAVPLALALANAGCDGDRAAAQDELTIVVRGDRRELELQEKALRQREEALRLEKEQIDQRIDQLAKGRSAADAEELARARALQKEMSLKLTTLAAQKTEVDAKRTAIDPPSDAVGAALSAREAVLASREAKLAERDAETSRRERELAGREKAAAAREQELLARDRELTDKSAALAAASKGDPKLLLRDVPRAQAVEQKHRKLLEELEARGILIADLPVEEQPLNAEIWSARRQGDFSRAADLLAELAKGVRGLKVDQRFVEAKMVRLQGARAQAALGEAQKKEVERLLHEVTAAYSDGRYDQANKGLNRISAILDAGGSPG